MKKLSKTIITVAVAALLLTMTPWQNARAASGTTAVEINFPSMIILHHPNTLTLTFNPGIDEALDEGTVTDTTTFAAPVFDAGLPVTLPGTVTSSVAVTVENVWAVRGMSAGGTFAVNPNLDTATNTSPGGSTLTMSNLQVKTDTVAAGDPISINASGMGMATAVRGDILFNLDFSGVTTTGLHTGMQYTIEVTAP